MKKIITAVTIFAIVLTSCGRMGCTLSIGLPDKGSFSLILEGKNGFERKIVNAKGECTFSDLEEGIYTLICFREKDGEVFKINEFTIRLNEGPNHLAIGEDGLIESGITISDGSSSPVEGRIEICEIDKQKNEIILSFRIDVLCSGIDEESLKYLWYEDGIFIEEGRYLSLDLSRSFKRIDVVLLSPLLGSIGSESLVFQAK